MSDKGKGEGEDSDGNRGDQLSLKQVHNYADRMVERGHAEYNKGSILVRSKHPLDECLRRGIIEQEHHDSGKRIRNYRDCALSKSSGRVYHAIGEGDSEMDAATIYANVMRMMSSTSGGKNHWKLVGIICFAEPNIDGQYGFGEPDYAALLKLAPNLHYAFERVDVTFGEARKELERKLQAEKKGREAN